MNSNNLIGVVSSKDITLRNTPGGTPVTSFTLKVKREYKTDSQSTKDKYDLITVVCWNNMALFAVDNLKTGTKVGVKGSIHTERRLLTNFDVFKDGNKVETFYMPVFEVYAEHLNLL